MKNKTILLALSLMLSLTAKADICDTSNDPMNADPEDKPLNDINFSYTDTSMVINRIEKNYKNKSYRIYENNITILKGHILLNRINELKIEMFGYKNKGYNLEGILLEIEEAKKEYCTFRKHSRLYDI